MRPRFWTLPLTALTPPEWEALCDGCGKCCLNKLEDWDTGDIVWTNVACRLLDAETCRCSDYENRQRQVPDCIGLTPDQVRSLGWLPPTCAYRLVEEGRDQYNNLELDGAIDNMNAAVELFDGAGGVARGRLVDCDGRAAVCEVGMAFGKPLGNNFVGEYYRAVFRTYKLQERRLIRRLGAGRQ